MKHQYLWAFSLIIFSIVDWSSSASIDITTIIPLEELEEDSTEVPISLDYNNDLAEELIDVENQVTTTTTSTSTSTTTTSTTTTTTTTSTTSTEAPDKSPKITREPSMIQAFTPGEPLVLECVAESMFDSKIEYSWTKNGHPFKVDDSKNVFSESAMNGNILFISPVKSDVGTYQCEAINSFGKDFSHSSLLRIQQPRNQPGIPRSFNSAPAPVQILVDPIIETKDSIERVPITQAVPEILPNLIQPKPEVFIVYPGVPEEPALVMNMETVQDDEN